MGQCYYVELKLNVENERKFIQLFKDYMENAERTVFNNTWKPDSVDNIIKIMLAADQNDFQRHDDGVYTSGFHGSYGWETVLDEFFTVIKPTLLKGSYITVYPDEGHWTREV